MDNIKIFVDTNIFPEYIEHRKQYNYVKLLLDALRKGKFRGFVSQGGIYTLAYLTERSLKGYGIHRPELTEQLRVIMKGIVSIVEPIAMSSYSIHSAIDDILFKDMEDSFQYQCAVENKCNVLVTINMGDFSQADQNILEILSPKAFVEKYLQE